MDTPDLGWQVAATSASSALHGQPFSEWRAALTALRPPGWPVAVAALLAVGLLLTFQQVVAHATVQAALRHTAMAAQHEAVSRCKLMPSRGDRDSCLADVANLVKPMEK
jgi:hypothetical protein